MILNRKIAPEFRQVNNIEFIDAINKKLDNGIDLNYLDGSSQDILKIDFIFKAGIWQQNKPLIASSTNRLIKEGTKSYTAYQIAEGIDNYGAFLEVENNFDSASVTLYTLNKYLNEVLPFVKEIICCPKLSKSEFEIHKKTATQRFKINLEKVSFLARKEFSSLIFGTSPYANNVSIEDYENLQLSDLQNFHKQHYQLNNCNILVSGKITTTVINTINEFFGKENIKNEPLSPKNKNIEYGKENKAFIKKEGALQSAIRIGKLMPNKLHKDYFGLKVFNTVLGGYFGSRLMNNIREDKGYTYGIGSGLISLKNSGYFFISTEVGSKVTEKALSEIHKEIEKLQNEKISSKELDLVKNYMLGQFLKSCDGAFNMASLFEAVNSYGLDYSFYNQYIETIKTITPKTLQELGVKYFNVNELKEVVVGEI